MHMARSLPNVGGLVVYSDKENEMSKIPRASPVCGAKTRRGSYCQAFRMPNGRCRMHGGTSPGAPIGNRNAWKHGRYSRHWKELQALARLAMGHIG
ncbi:HGGxSTG domain-containing protein [Hyphomonas sp.]|uniref:HGGxSTG domain-containing protein n=1 Tax=Hyphomonas sp. TaxID=87 RepID=UPI003FA55236